LHREYPDDFQTRILGQNHMKEVALMKWWNAEIGQLVALPTKRDVQLGCKIFEIIEDSREWVPASQVDTNGRLIGA
jgi:hypothetical protein